MLVCLESPEISYGGKDFTIDRSLDDKNNRIVVFPFYDSTDIKRVAGTLALTGKDNVALVSKWDRKATIDVVSWGRDVSWEGSLVTALPLEYLDNGHVAYLKNGTAVDKRNDVNSWVTTTNVEDATPGELNK
ncbi:MAG: hypothetical protein HYV28_09395 [Ignavibacteriales bacterium]|nr:hypothetical protein [Ignavibacteriales bacterium]